MSRGRLKKHYVGTYNDIKFLYFSHIYRGHAHWMCKCHCGNDFICRATKVTSGERKSCGKCPRPEPKNKLPEGTSCINSIASQYKNGARKRNLEWNISKEQFKSLITSDCFYCGSSPSCDTSSLAGNGPNKNRYNGFILRNGIDRVDSSIGYNTNNCVSCCKTCNLAKRSLSVQQWLAWIEAIYSNISEIKSKLLLV